MNEKKILKIFIDILESTPGVFEILQNGKDSADDAPDKLRVENINGKWNLVASIIVFKNANCKDILNSINSLLRYTFKNNKIKLGKLNIFVEGITND